MLLTNTHQLDASYHPNIQYLPVQSWLNSTLLLQNKQIDKFHLTGILAIQALKSVCNNDLLRILNTQQA